MSRPRIGLSSAIALWLSSGLVLIAVAAGLRLLLDRPPPDVELANGTRLEWTDCWFSRPWWKTVHCGYLQPARAANAMPMSLALVVIRRHLWRRDPEPMLYLPGGPGSGAWLDPGDVGNWFEWIEELDWPHDLVLFDPRGVGRSEPTLDCPVLRQLARQGLAGVFSPAESQARYRDEALRCRDRLLAAGHDLADYTTEMAVRDVRDLFWAMQIEAWNLYGVSYGSRVALEVLRRDPVLVRSAILDSVYPPQFDALLTWPSLLDGAIQGVLDFCAADPICRADYPQLESTLDAVMTRLGTEPVWVSATDPYEGEEIEVLVNDERLAYVLFDASYYWDLLPELAPMIAELEDGDLNRFSQLLDYHLASVLDPEASHAVYLSVECRDARQIARDTYLEEVARYPRVARYVRDAWQFDVCPDWPSGRAPSDFHQPVVSNVPVLLLAGDYDPITPARWAKEAARSLAGAQLFVRPEIGHGVLDSEVCAGDIARAFLARPWQPPQADCLVGAQSGG